MYIPEAFEESRELELTRVIEQFPLGSLSYCVNGRIDAIHIPFEYVPSARGGLLRAHVSRANPIWKALANGAEVLVVFRSEDAYVSPNWYPSKHEFHRQVPTWNYQVVHVRGHFRAIDDEKVVRGIVARLTRSNEARVQETKPWKMSDSAADYIDALLKEIVAIEIEITQTIGITKASQNKDDRDRQSVAENMQRVGKCEMSRIVAHAKNAQGTPRS
ncbi:FMN-binding negative transcriptional regulator [Paludibacterium purpuratum]|uniref:PaiB family negative transcriptional regulator n=1 Tax=Paludibacterium purpuratum TaxID=1144873 RepID=A0A4R7BDR7_9NEIS|nr:FMN-binding negative transcriptional regulator [Paludibacterium purpuratum]TDR82135.1 PaiB family negative transcriptional regulator [Paludibacterium purpuratum]